jgi:hypothetical protein
MLWATLRMKLSVLINKIKGKRVYLQLTSNPTVSSSCISNSHLHLTNFMLINKHHEMVTLLYVTTITGHFLSACATYTTSPCSGQFVLDVTSLLAEGKHFQHLLAILQVS